MKLRKKKSNGTLGAIIAIAAFFCILIFYAAIGAVIPAGLAWILMHFVFGASVTYTGVYWFVFTPIVILILVGAFFNSRV